MKLKSIFEITAKLLYPPRCPICDEAVALWEEGICRECLKKVKYVLPPFCCKCGKHLEAADEELCADCRDRKYLYTAGRALYEYKSIAKSLYRFKYGGRQEYAKVYGEEISFYLGEFFKEIHPDALIPVPMYPGKERRRGYNQSLLLAKAIGECTKIPVYQGIIRRIRDTKPLKLLNPEERLNNLKKAFILNENGVKLKVVVIIDDIYTTGSTVDEMTRVFLDAGVQKVYFVTLAIGETI